jgi:hypothetical protein
MALSDAAQLAFGATVDEEIARARTNAEAFRSNLTSAVANLTALGVSAQALQALQAQARAEGIALGEPAAVAITAAQAMTLKGAVQVAKAVAVSGLFDDEQAAGLANAFAALDKITTALAAKAA